MRIQLLGRVTVAIGGRRHSFPRSQVRGLFAFLALQAGQPVSMQTAIEALWGGRPPGTARTRVHGYVLTIRQALLEWGAPDCVESGRFGYLLRVPHDRVDAVTLACGPARRAPMPGTRSPAIARHWRCGEARRSPTRPESASAISI